MPSHTDLFAGLFRRHTQENGEYRIAHHDGRPDAIPCPTTGRLLRVETIEVAAPAICPSCANRGQGGFVSFVGDLRLVYACPQCCQLVWLAGA
jgi:hypothetical protein